jgi:hypothetical protein
MKAKEKARELVNKYNSLQVNFFGDQAPSYGYAKRCALIAVDEIISSNPHSNPLNTNVESTMEYWQEVKQEIENL